MRCGTKYSLACISTKFGTILLLLALNGLSFNIALWICLLVIFWNSHCGGGGISNWVVVGLSLGLLGGRTFCRRVDLWLCCP